MIFDKLLPKVVETTVWQSLLESNAAEHGAVLQILGQQDRAALKLRATVRSGGAGAPPASAVGVVKLLLDEMHVPAVASALNDEGWDVVAVATMAACGARRTRRC